MEEKFLPRHEHDEFAKRMEEEHKRQNKRIGDLEDGQKERHRMLVSIEKMAVNMEIMQKEQRDQGERLEVLENRDGDKWRKAEWVVIGGVIGAVVVYICGQIGL